MRYGPILHAVGTMICMGVVVAIPQAVNSQGGLRTTSVVGEMEGTGPQAFGLIRSIAARPNGEFFVLDSQSKTLSWFSSTGKHLGTVGRKGSGPGEFLDPRAVTMSGEDILVLDGSNRRIETFRTTQQGLRYISGKPHVLGGRSFCSNQGRIFVNVLREGFLVHEIGESTTPRRSFGPAPVPKGTESLGGFKQLADGMLTAGVIACLDQTDLIVVAATAQPIVSAYRLDGSVAWTTKLTAYNQLAFELSSAGALRTRIDSPDGAHVAQYIARWSDSTVVVQYELRRSAQRSEGMDAPYESRVFDIRTGAEIERRRDLPIVAATAGKYVYSARSNPFPQITVMTRQ